MSLRLIVTPSSDLDAYEAAQRERDQLAARYGLALDAGDRLDLALIEALASDWDQRHPGEPSLLDELGTYDTAVAA